MSNIEEKLPKQKQTYGTNKTAIIDEMQQIRKLRIIGTDHETIRYRLKLSQDQYYRRVASINKIDEEYVKNNFHQELASEIVTCQSRFLGTINNCDRIATDDRIEAKDRLEAERIKMDCSIGLVNLFIKGPAILDSHIQNVIISKSERIEELANKYETRPGLNSISAPANPNTTDDPERQF